MLPQHQSVSPRRTSARFCKIAAIMERELTYFRTLTQVKPGRPRRPGEKDAQGINQPPPRRASHTRTLLRPKSAARGGARAGIRYGAQALGKSLRVAPCKSAVCFRLGTQKEKIAKSGLSAAKFEPGFMVGLGVFTRPGPSCRLGSGGLPATEGPPSSSMNREKPSDVRRHRAADTP